jgi:hypothetical protein
MIACGMKLLATFPNRRGWPNPLPLGALSVLPSPARCSNPALRAATPPGSGTLLVLAPLLLVEDEEFFDPEGDRFACESQGTGSAFAFEGE